MTVTIDDIRDAKARLAGKAVVTPLVEAPLLNRRLGCRILVKAENLQLTGSFKFRGAYNRISRLAPASLAKGVVAYSSGNHAQGVAAAASVVGTHATIVVPKDIPAIKEANTRAWGAELVHYDRDSDDRVALAEDVARRLGDAEIVPPFDHADVIAGQGTIGIEIMEQAAALGTAPDAVVIPCGGGGLSAGIATAVKALRPDTRVFLAEPTDWDDTRRSLAAGRRVAVEADGDRPATMCDALGAPMPGALTFPILERLAEGAVAIDDAQTARGVCDAFGDLKLVLEPSGAIALAAVTSGALGGLFAPAGKTIAVVASGGNVDAALFAAILSGAAGKPGAR